MELKPIFSLSLISFLLFVKLVEVCEDRYSQSIVCLLVEVCEDRYSQSIVFAVIFFVFFQNVMSFSLAINIITSNWKCVIFPIYIYIYIYITLID